MNVTTHTDTPWYVYSQNSNMVVNAAATKVIASTESETGEYAEAKANAAFIVKAVNSHEQLVAALKHALGVMVNSDDATPEMIGAVDIAAQALKAAMQD